MSDTATDTAPAAAPELTYRQRVHVTRKALEYYDVEFFGRGYSVAQARRALVDLGLLPEKTKRGEAIPLRFHAKQVCNYWMNKDRAAGAISSRRYLTVKEWSALRAYVHKHATPVGPGVRGFPGMTLAALAVQARIDGIFANQYSVWVAIESCENIEVPPWKLPEFNWRSVDPGPAEWAEGEKF